MGDYLKDMFIEVRERDETISPLTELEQMMASVNEVLRGVTVVQEEAREGTDGGASQERGSEQSGQVHLSAHRRGP